jgi:hypothetical protein
MTFRTDIRHMTYTIASSIEGIEVDAQLLSREPTLLSARCHNRRGVVSWASSGVPRTVRKSELSTHKSAPYADSESSPDQLRGINKFTVSLCFALLLFTLGCGSVSTTPYHVSLQAAQAQLYAGQTMPLALTVTGAPASSTEITLSCQSQNCGTATPETYTAPTTLQSADVVTITASIVQAPEATASIQVQLVPIPTILAASPQTIPAGTQGMITIVGYGFGTGVNATVNFEGVGSSPSVGNVQIVNSQTMTVLLTSALGAQGTLSLSVHGPSASTPASPPYFLGIVPADTPASNQALLFDVNDYGAVGDGVANDTPAINQAVNACYASGGGTVLFDSGNTYRVIRVDPASQWPGGIILQPGCSLSGYGATIYVDDDTNGIGPPSAPARHIIVSDIRPGDVSLVLDSAEGLQVGQRVYYCYNQIPSNPAECSSFGSANITDISGSTIFLDQPLPSAMSESATPPANRWLVQPEFLEGISIEGLSFTANWAGGASIEEAISIQYGRNLLFRDLTFDEPGAGGIVLQFVDEAKIENVNVTSAAQDDGHASMGRGLSFSESTNVQTVNFTCSNFVHSPIDIEAASSNLWFDQIMLHDSDPNAAANAAYFGSGDGSRFGVGTITVDGTGSPGNEARGTLVGAVSPVQATFNLLIDKTIDGIQLGQATTVMAIQREAP